MSNDTMWFERTPGSSVAQGTTDPCSLLITDDTSDWVRLPAELGGARMRVAGATIAPCPSCPPFEGENLVRHLILADSKIAVAECSQHGFQWYMMKQKSPERAKEMTDGQDNE